LQYPNRNNQSFNDPILRVKPSVREGDPSAGVKRFGIPIFGITGMACYFAWLVLCVVPPTFIGEDAFGAFGVQRLVFLAALVLSCALSCACPPTAFATRSLRVLGVVAAVLSPAGWVGYLVGLASAPSVALWAVSGVAAGLLSIVWAVHLAAFTSQSQTMVAVAGSLMAGIVLAYVSFSFTFPQSLVLCLAFPVLSAIVHFKAAPRVAKRDELLRSQASERKSVVRYLVKEEWLSVACLLLAGYLVSFLAFEGFGPWAMLVLSVAVFVGSFIMFEALLHLTESLAFTLLGFVVPFLAVFALIAACTSQVARTVAIGAMLLAVSCLMVIHVSNATHNSKHLFDDYARAVRLVIAIDAVAFAGGWAIASACLQMSWFGEQSFAMGLLSLFAIAASLVALCLFTASPESRHVPRMFADEGSEARGLLGSLRPSVLVTEFEFDRDLENGDADTANEDEMLSTTTAERFAANVDRIIEPYNLSAREKDVFMYLARGYNAQSIAQKLTLSPNTVKTHIRNIYAKFDIHSQQDLVAYVEQLIP